MTRLRLTNHGSLLTQALEDRLSASLRDQQQDHHLRLVTADAEAVYLSTLVVAAAGTPPLRRMLAEATREEQGDTVVLMAPDFGRRDVLALREILHRGSSTSMGEEGGNSVLGLARAIGLKCMLAGKRVDSADVGRGRSEETKLSISRQEVAEGSELRRSRRRRKLPQILGSLY